jgi:tetratricopeptide (TPR) repeat protein
MSNEDQILFERIESYLLGTQSADEKEAFEVELEASEALRAEVEVQRELQTSIELGSLASTLDDIHGSHHSSKLSSGKKWLSLAAGLAVFLVLTYWFTSAQTRAEELFAEYKTTEPGMPVPMSSTNQYDFYDAMVDYKTEKYDLAIRKWSALLVEKPHNDTVLYFIGSAHYNLNQYETALNFYGEMGVDSAGPYMYKAQWYTLLCDLKLGNNASVLNVIPDVNSPYAERILSIQQALKE